jgi:tetratricopeptide (TPR) repeat protein
MADAVADYKEAVKRSEGGDPRALAENYSNRALAHRFLKKWDEARADFAYAIELAPDDWQVFHHRGNLYLRLDRAADAVADFAAATRLQPDRTDVWYYLALAHLAAGDADAYRKVCVSLAERFRDEQRADACRDLALTCTLAADAGVEPARLLGWAETVAKARPTDAVHLKAAAVALYRAGRYDEALSRLREAEKAAKGGAEIDLAFFMALALHRSGQADPAREWLARAIGSHDKVRKEDPDVPNARLWSQQFQFGALRAEAEATLKTPPGPPRP